MLEFVTEAGISYDPKWTRCPRMLVSQTILTTLTLLHNTSLYSVFIYLSDCQKNAGNPSADCLDNMDTWYGIS